MTLDICQGDMVKLTADLWRFRGDSVCRCSQKKHKKIGRAVATPPTDSCRLNAMISRTARRLRLSAAVPCAWDHYSTARRSVQACAEVHISYTFGTIAGPIEIGETGSRKYQRWNDILVARFWQTSTQEAQPFAEDLGAVRSFILKRSGFYFKK